MRITFVGAGAVGGYFGARMAQAGMDVSFLLRPASAVLLRSRGLRVRSHLGDFELQKPEVLGDAATPRAPDVMFFACKAEHVRSAAELARPFFGSDTIAIPLQNGVDAPETLCEVLDADRVLGGLSRIFAERVSPGEIVHMALGPSISCGEREGGTSERVTRIVEDLAPVSGMAIDASDDIWSEMWKKLLMVCSMGAVGAAARAPLAVLLEVPETLGLLESACKEIATVARAHGAAIPDTFAAQQIARCGNLPPTTTASMHRDLERGDSSELSEQLGTVCRRAKEAGVPTPVLDALFGALLPGEMRARGHLTYENVGSRET